MEKALNKYGMGTRIITVVSVLLLVLLISVGTKVSELYSSSKQITRVQELADFAPFVSSVVHEMQKERGASAGFIGSGGSGAFNAVISSQHKETDKARMRLDAALKEFAVEDYGLAIMSKLNVAQKKLDTLKSKRKSVLRLNETVGSMAGYYTGTIADLLNIVKEIANLTDEASLLKDTVTYISLLEAKERAGQERAMGANGFAKGAFSDAIFNKFVSLIAAQKSFMASFNAYASEDFKRLYSNTVKGSDVDRVEELRKYAISHPGDLTGAGVTGSQWFGIITNKINLLKKVEDGISVKLIDNSHNMAEEAYTGFLILSLLAVALFIVIVTITILIIRSIVRPLERIEYSMGEISSGNLEIDVPHLSYGGEIGTMASAVQTFKEAGIEQIKLQADVEEARQDRKIQRQKARELESQREEESRQQEREELKKQEQRTHEMETLIKSFDSEIVALLEGLGETSSQLSSSADSMADLASQTTSDSTSAAAASEQASANVSTVAAATEEMAASIAEISRQIGHSSEMTSKAFEQTESTKAIVGNLSQTSGLIADVVQLINDIAEQTNLLALNATIEAARAGEAGRGFAVVASEVKALANQTAKATEDITEHVSAVQKSSTEVSKAVEEIGEAINDANDAAMSITSAVAEQDAATGEIARNVQDASEGSREVSEVINNVSASATRTQGIVTDVHSASKEVSDNTKIIKEVAERFLVGIRAI